MYYTAITATNTYLHTLSLPYARQISKLRAYSEPAVRRNFHQEVVEWVADLPGASLGRRWYDYIWVGETVLPQNQQWQGKSIREMAEAQGKGDRKSTRLTSSH